eukprot:COSAG01_NODE_12532_length_1724_cov_2.030769_1_plen_335_part_00
MEVAVPEPEPEAHHQDEQAVGAVASWGDLPAEVLLGILSELPTADVSLVGSVCKHWLGPSRNNWLWRRRASSRWVLAATANLTGPAEPGSSSSGSSSSNDAAARWAPPSSSGGNGSQEGDEWWWRFYCRMETEGFLSVQLTPGDHVDCRWGDNLGERYHVPRLGGCLQGTAFWEAQVLEAPDAAHQADTQAEAVHVHYVGYDAAEVWARETVSIERLRPTGLPDWTASYSAGDVCEVCVQPPPDLHDTMYWAATVVAARRCRAPTSHRPARTDADATEPVEDAEGSGSWGGGHDRGEDPTGREEDGGGDTEDERAEASAEEGTLPPCHPAFPAG